MELFMQKIYSVFTFEKNIAILNKQRFYLNQSDICIFMKECANMSRMVGTVSHGLRAPIIRSGDDLALPCGIGMLWP